jgi:hypothetical protein
MTDVTAARVNNLNVGDEHLFLVSLLPLSCAMGHRVKTLAQRKQEISDSKEQRLENAHSFYHTEQAQCMVAHSSDMHYLSWHTIPRHLQDTAV